MKKIIMFLLLITPLCLLGQTRSKAAIKRAPAGVASLINGAKVYKLNCLTCHQADGGGVPNMNPPLINTTYVNGDKARIIKIVLNGFAQNVEINGEVYSNTMPPQNLLTDKEIADVLTYVRGSFGNKSSAVTVAQVKAVRASNK